MRPSEVPQEWVEAGVRAAYENWRKHESEQANTMAAVLAALIPAIRAAALRDHAADAYKIDRTAPEAINAWLLRMARMEEQK
jgi:hypothetical protein